MVDLDSPISRTNPGAVINVMLLSFYGEYQNAYPFTRQVQLADLTFSRVGDHVVANSDLFFSNPLSSPLLAAGPSGRGPLLSLYLEHFVVLAYQCWSQIVLAVDPYLDETDLPTVKEFDALVRFLAPSDSLPIVYDIFRWIAYRDPLFGVDEDGQFASAREKHLLASHCRRLLLETASTPSDQSRVRKLQRLLSDDFDLLVNVVEAGHDAFSNLDAMVDYTATERTLAYGFNTSCLLLTRVIAAEYLSYIRNRLAVATSDPDDARDGHAEAARLAHFAYAVSGTPRYTKYVAQNLLEMARLTNNAALGDVAEVLWIDAYLMPYLHGLLLAGEPAFQDLGWTHPILSRSDDFGRIPRHTTNEGFLYGLLAGNIALPPGFASDLWSGSILLTQYFKDSKTSRYISPPDLKLAVYRPDSVEGTRFPLRSQHPIAWLYHLAQALVEEVRTGRHRHAGLHQALPAERAYRLWVDEEVRSVMGNQGKLLKVRTVLRLPNTCKWLLSPAMADQDVSLASTAFWAHIVKRWS